MKKILIVDDDVDFVNLIENRLRKNNYDVIFANDGEDGYKKAVLENPDLIIMDIMMPNMSGGESVKLLKANEATKDTPIIFFTALTKGTELDQINVNGELYPSISKPFNPNKLLSAIKSLIG